MLLSEVREILKADILTGEENLDREVTSACGSDFMSDVLAYVKNQALLLTGLVNPQVVRTADLLCPGENARRIGAGAGPGAGYCHHVQPHAAL